MFELSGRDVNKECSSSKYTHSRQSCLKTREDIKQTRVDDCKLLLLLSCNWLCDKNAVAAPHSLSALARPPFSFLRSPRKAAREQLSTV